MTCRLATVAPDVVELLTGETDDRLRRHSAAAIRLGLRAADVRDQRIDRALVALDTGRYGESPERTAIKNLADDLDETAWDTQDQVEAGRASQDEYLAAFARARSASGLWFALDPDPQTAALEAIYEVIAGGAGQDVRRAIGIDA